MKTYNTPKSEIVRFRMTDILTDSSQQQQDSPFTPGETGNVSQNGAGPITGKD